MRLERYLVSGEDVLKRLAAGCQRLAVEGEAIRAELPRIPRGAGGAGVLRGALPRFALVVALLLGVCTSAGAQITVSGPIPAGTVWSVADSPVQVIGDLIIYDLTILAGVDVQFTGNYRVTVTGIIRCFGSSDAPVLFRPQPGSTAGWLGLVFQDTIPGSEFWWTEIEGANDSAVQLIRSYPKFNNVTFRNNRAPSYGGALRAELHDQDLYLSNCRFARNYADTAGGAIYAVGPTGSGDAALILTDTTLVQNNAGTTGEGTLHNTFGGALFIYGNSIIFRCTFIENEARAYTIYIRGGRYTQGGGLYASGGRTEIIATLFLRNACRMGAHSHTPDASRAYGGAMYLSSGELFISNSIVAHNTLAVIRHSDYRGGALYCAGGVCSIVNSTMAANSFHAVYRDGGDVVILNSILFDNNNSGAQIADSSGTLTATYSDIQNGFDGEGNIAFNPIFDERYRVVVLSPAIDAGHPDAQYNDVFPPGLGAARNDMGAHGGPRAECLAGTDSDSCPESPPRLDIRISPDQTMLDISEMDVLLAMVRLTNDATPREVDLLLWLDKPSGTVPIASRREQSLRSNLDFSRPFTIGTAGRDRLDEAGEYVLGARILDPLTGQTLAFDLRHVTVVP